MAKKTVKKEGALPDVFSMVKSIDDSAEIIEDSAYSNIDDWIGTGNYLLNASISGSLFGGIPSGRVTTLVGESGCGKSYLACSIVREAQKKGYTGIYLDSEGAIDSKFVSRLGVDPKKLIIKQVNTVLETSQFILNLCEQLKKQEDEYGRCQRIIIVLDSLGNLTSEAEKSNLMAGENKADLKKAQAVKALFRTCAVPCAKYHIPLIVVSHVYASLNMYSPGNVVSGGSGLSYNSSVTLEMAAKKLADKESEAAAQKATSSDDVLKAGVLVTAKPRKSRFTISRKTTFSIPYFKKPNPYIGIETYLSWDTAGICRGAFLTEKEYNKLSDADKAKIHVFDYNGETKYVQEKDTARNIIVKHLGAAVPFTEFFTEKVFTDAFLHELDERVIRPAFELPDQSSFDDIREIEDLIEVGNEPAEEE